MKLLGWLETGSDTPTMVAIKPYSEALCPDPEKERARQVVVDALIKTMGVKWAGHAQYVHKGERK